MAEKIRIVLPQKYDLVVGDTFQLFYRGVIECPNPYVYSIVSICEKGRNFPRYFEYAPTEPGQHKLAIKVYDAQRNLLGEGETLLNVVVPKQPKHTTKIMCIGDSLTGGGWTYEAYRRITQEGGAPAGLGFANAVQFIGTQTSPKYPGIATEGHSGGCWDGFLYSLPNTIQIEYPNARPAADEGSLWQDINGNIWKLVTLKIDYPKFRRYNNPDAPLPEHGPFVHYSGAQDTTPFEFDHTESGGALGSPFMNPETEEVDFLDYCKRNNVEAPDAVYIFLGNNGLMTAEANSVPRKEYSKLVVNKGKKLVGYLKKAFPNVKVKIMGLPHWAVNGGMGMSYGASLPLTDHYEIYCYHMQLSEAYQAWCLEDEYKDFMEFINIAGQFDCEYNFPRKEKPVNTRSTVMEWIDGNGCHPSPEGYKQIGDAVYRNIVASFCSE